MSTAISTAELIRALSLRDLTDPAAGPHAMQQLLAAIYAALPAPVLVHRASPIVSIEHNYDRLGYPPDGAARDARYTRYVCATALLRTQTSALIPPLLRSITPPDEVVLACPGIVYRRDVIDRLHVGRTLTHDECNDLRDAIYSAIHRGAVQQLINRRPRLNTSGSAGLSA